MEIITDTIYNSTFADSDIDIEKKNILQELQVSFAMHLSVNMSLHLLFLSLLLVLLVENTQSSKN